MENGRFVAAGESRREARSSTPRVATSSRFWSICISTAARGGYQRRQARGSSRHGGLRGVARRHGDVPCDYDAVEEILTEAAALRQLSSPAEHRADLVGSTWRVRSSRPSKVGRAKPRLRAQSRRRGFRRLQKEAGGLFKIVDIAPRPAADRFIEQLSDEVRISLCHTCADYAYRGACLQARRAAPDASVQRDELHAPSQAGSHPRRGGARRRDGRDHRRRRASIRHGAPVQHVRRRS